METTRSLFEALMTISLTDSLLAIGITLIMYIIGRLASRKFGPFVNSIAVAMIGVIVVILVLGIEPESYNAGSKWMTVLITPATAALALPMYRYRKLLKERWLTIVVAASVCLIVSSFSIMIIGGLLGIDMTVLVSLLPKTVTTAIAVPVSEQLAGIISLTVVSVILTGITGAVFGPLLFKWFNIADESIKGTSLGTCAHVIGTAKANDLSEEAASFSSVSLIVTGLMMVGVMMVIGR